ncbi:MAG: carboxynorspermidine decarboxylase, partial [Pseudomonadota bacterium]
MRTQAGDPGAFRSFDLSRVPSPCFVIDEIAIERNLSILRTVADASGARVLAALKAFSMFSVAPLMSRYL